MPEAERVEIIKAFACVDEVMLTSHGPDDPDRSVSRDLERLHPDVFANGGDRRAIDDIPEAEVCRRLGIEMVFNILSNDHKYYKNKFSFI